MWMCWLWHIVTYSSLDAGSHCRECHWLGFRRRNKTTGSRSGRTTALRVVALNLLLPDTPLPSRTFFMILCCSIWKLLDYAISQVVFLVDSLGWRWVWYRSPHNVHEVVAKFTSTSLETLRMRVINLDTNHTRKQLKLVTPVVACITSS